MGAYLSDDPYYHRLPNFVSMTSVEWANGLNKSYPWLTLLATEDEITHSVQQIVREYQNPSNCSGVSYFQYTRKGAGMGSDFHFQSMAMVGAMMFDSLLLLANDPQSEWVDMNICPKESRSFDCYFEPLSTCKEFIMNDAKNDSPTVKEIYIQILARDRLKIPYMLYQYQGKYFQADNPHFFWRAQFIKYMFRPNSKTLQAWKDTLTACLVRLTPENNSHEHIDAASHAPPLGMIGMHIRHGDKWKEGNLHPFEEYMEAAEHLVRNFTGLSRNIVLGTDNEHIIEQLESNKTARRHFTFYYLLFPRKNEGGESMHQARSIGVYKYVMDATLNLMIGTHPNIGAFVHTTSSNYDRLINELRRTDGRRGAAPIIDLEPGDY